MDFEARFHQHLEAAKSKRRLRLKQGFFNLRMFYLLPVLLSMTIANTFAHSLFNGKSQPIEWMATAFGITFLLLPFAFRFLRKDMMFDKDRFYLLDAIKETMTTQDRTESEKIKRL